MSPLHVAMSSDRPGTDRVGLASISEDEGPRLEPLRLPLLMPHDRIARRPLGKWADDLRAQLQNIRNQNRDAFSHLQALAPCANNASLMEVYRGDISAAEEMCHAQYDFAAEAASRDESLAAFCVQPWINLGRLYGRTGHPDRALRMFEQLWNVVRGEGETGDVPECVVTGIGYVGAEHDGGRRFCRSMYVLDSMQVLTFTGRYAELGTFSREAPLTGWTRWHVAEADVIAKAGVDKNQQAAKNAMSLRQEVRTWKKMSVLLHLARILKRLGQRRTMHKILQQLMVLCDQLPIRHESNVSHLLVVAEIGEVALTQGDCYELPEVAAAGLHAAKELEDVPLQDRFLSMLISVGESPHEHRVERDAVRSTSGYRRYNAEDHEGATVAMDALRGALLTHMGRALNSGTI